MEHVCAKEIPQMQLIGTEQHGWKTWCRRPEHHAGECAPEPLEDDPATVE